MTTENQTINPETDTASRVLSIFEHAARLKAKLDSPEFAERERKANEERDADKAKRERAEAARSLESLLGSVGSKYKDCTVQGFEVYEEGQAEVVRLVVDFCGDISANVRDGKNVLLFGPPGTGKDHLLVAMLKLACRNSYTVKWFNGATLFSRIRDNISSDESEAKFIAELVNNDVLGLSDPQPARGSLTDFQASKLFEIVDARYRKDRPTWVTMNVADRPEAERRIGAAVIDRLAGHGALACCCNWQSYRARKIV